MKPSVFILFTMGVLLSFLGGCTAHAPKDNLPPSYHFRDTTKFGVVVYSQVSDHSTNRVFIEEEASVKDQLNYSEFIYHPLYTPMINKEEYQGALHFLALPEGDYVMNRWHVQTGGKLLVQTGWTATFHVEPKKIIYLGRLNIKEDGQQTWMDVEDQLGEDGVMFQKAVPKLAELPINKELVPSVAKVLTSLEAETK